jgi:hypothetical protein
MLALFLQLKIELRFFAATLIAFCFERFLAKTIIADVVQF